MTCTCTLIKWSIIYRIAGNFRIFVKSKTWPPELIFVVLNFVALDATPHSPSSENLPMIVTKVTETEISSLILYSIVEDTQQDGEMPCVRSRLCAHLWRLFSRRPLPTVAKFRDY